MRNAQRTLSLLLAALMLLAMLPTAVIAEGEPVPAGDPVPVNDTDPADDPEPASDPALAGDPDPEGGFEPAGDPEPADENGEVENGDEQAQPEEGQPQDSEAEALGDDSTAASDTHQTGTDVEYDDDTDADTEQPIQEEEPDNAPDSDDITVYVVSFDLRGHGTAIAPINVEADGTIKKPSTPQADGFTFTGWYREPSCEREWSFDTDTVTENLTLYAGWEEIPPEETVEQSEEAPLPLEPDEEPVWSLSLPGSQQIAYKAERTRIGTISVKEASGFTDGQAISVTLDYSSFSSDTHSIPIEITVKQNGTERTWRAGTTILLSPDGSDPITIFVNISAEAWMAASHGAYAMSLVFHSALAGR